MKFNINKYMGNYAMHCKTEEEAKIFCRYLDSVGRRWADGTSYMSMTNWDDYDPDTCYDFNDGTYCVKRYFLTRNYYTILEFSDFEWDNKNTKRKPVIIYRNGQDVIALDKETGEKAVAKCHPNDEFDFAIGAKIAFGRLYHSQDYISEGNEAKCKPKFQVGDRVRCIKEDCEIRSINIVNELGVIREAETGASSVLVEFDNNIGGHSGGGKGKDNHCWWVMNSSEYLELVDNKDAKEINVGDRVKVIDTGCAYNSYTEWVTKNAPEFAVCYMYCASYFYPSIRERITASTFTVVAKAPHTDFADRTLYLIQDEFARCFLFGEEGLKKCD
jgi:hypothetical protein